MTKKNSILKDTILVFALSLASKVIAFVKSVIQASYYGSTLQTDVYNITNEMVSNFLVLFSTALAVSFVPIYIRKKNDDGPEGARTFATRTITAMTLFALLIFLVLEIAAPLIMRIVAPAYSGEVLGLSVTYFRVLVTGLVFSLIASIYQSLLNSERIYGYANVSSVINSVIMIAVICIFAHSLGIWAMVIAVPVSCLAQLLVLGIRGRKYGGLSFSNGIYDKDIGIMVAAAVPILIGQASVEINQVVDRALLTSVEDGAVTSVTYSAILYLFVSGIIVASISTVLFTELSEAGAQKDMDRMQNILKRVFVIVIIICLPITIITLFTSMDIVNIVYGHGRFEEKAIEQTSTGLAAYIICLLPMTVKNVVLRAYYALNDTKRPMVIGIIEVAINIALSILLVRYWGIFGVVIATAIAAIVCVVVLLIDFIRNKLYNYKPNSCKVYLKITAAVSVMVLMLFVMKRYLSLPPLASFITNTAASGMAYFLVLLALREENVVQTVKRAVGFLYKK